MLGDYPAILYLSELIKTGLLEYYCKLESFFSL